MATAETPLIHKEPVAHDFVATSQQDITGSPDKHEHTSIIDEVAGGVALETSIHPSEKPDTMMTEPDNTETEPVHADTGSGEMTVDAVASPKAAGELSHTSQKDQGATPPKLDADRPMSPPSSRKRGASEAGLEQEPNRPKERRRDFSQEEKKRGQRLFGGLLSTLSQKPPGRRQPVERKQHEKTQQRKDEDNRRKAEIQEKLAKLSRRRKIQQIKLDEQTMRARHDDMLAKAYSLRTKTRPSLYYRPWEFTSEEEDIIDEQVRDAKEDIERELREFEQLDDLDRQEREDKDKKDGKKDGGKDDKNKSGDGDDEMKDAEPEEDDVLDEEILSLSTQDILTRRRLLENDSRIMRSEYQRLSHERQTMQEKIKDNLEKIANNRQLPYLVGNVVELLDLDPTAESSEEGANIDLDATRVGKSAVIKTSTRQTIFLPLIGLVDPATLKPADLIGVNKDSYLILDTLPAEYDSRVKAMEVDEKPTEKYSDVGGLDKQIEELVEAIVWPMKEAERFKKIGIKAPKGALMYGPPGTGKTLLARACAAQTDATFLKLAGPQLVQMFIGDGAKLVRDCFALAKEKAPSIIFIDELDAVGTKRFDSEKSGDREVQRTMLELLNQLDGFASDDRIKVLAATNRVDVLDPALLRSGRLDRKIEFPLPNEEARAQILKIHSRKMRFDPAVNWGELARSTDEFGGAMLKAVCVEAGMIALRMGKNKIGHEHYVDAIAEVQAKKKDTVNFYA
ncbi:hypothetical protein PspLS_02153 [Pyricularia sp. CBS 133598]|nr:hypothetical protein PspLS_02153 [Pyricularia sp. CBS 133598]